MLKQSIGRILECKVAEVEHAPQPLVIVSYEIDIFLDSHDASVGEGGLVQVVLYVVSWSAMNLWTHRISDEICIAAYPLEILLDMAK